MTTSKAQLRSLEEELVEGSALSEMMQDGYFRPKWFNPEYPLTLQECRDEVRRFYYWKKDFEQRKAASSTQETSSPTETPEVNRPGAHVFTSACDQVAAGIGQPDVALPSTVPVNYHQIYNEMREDKREQELKTLIQLWDIYQDETYTEPTPSGDQAPLLNDDNSPATASDLGNLMEHTTSEEKPVSKRAAMIAKAQEAAKSGGVLLNKPKSQIRAAQIKAKSAHKKPNTAATQQSQLEKFQIWRAQSQTQHRAREAQQNADLAAGQPIQVLSLVDLNHRLLQKLPRSEYCRLPANYATMNEEGKAEVLMVLTNSSLESHGQVAGQPGQTMYTSLQGLSDVAPQGHVGQVQATNEPSQGSQDPTPESLAITDEDWDDLFNNHAVGGASSQAHLKVTGAEADTGADPPSVEENNASREE